MAQKRRRNSKKEEKLLVKCGETNQLRDAKSFLTGPEVYHIPKRAQLSSQHKRSFSFQTKNVHMRRTTWETFPRFFFVHFHFPSFLVFCWTEKLKVKLKRGKGEGRRGDAGWFKKRLEEMCIIQYNVNDWTSRKPESENMQFEIRKVFSQFLLSFKSLHCDVFMNRSYD